MFRFHASYHEFVFVIIMPGINGNPFYMYTTLGHIPKTGAIKNQTLLFWKFIFVNYIGILDVKFTHP